MALHSLVSLLVSMENHTLGEYLCTNANFSFNVYKPVYQFTNKQMCSCAPCVPYPLDTCVGLQVGCQVISL